MYAKHLLLRLTDWLEDTGLLSKYQAGFRKKTSTIDQVFRFLRPCWKYISLRKGSLYVSFVDLKAAFDMVPRRLLWSCLKDLGVPIQLLAQIIRLHEGTYANVRWGPRGQLTRDVDVNRGVRQGCVQAPTLFTLYVNDIPTHQEGCNNDSPRLAGETIPALLFADDTILISQTPRGLQNLLNSFHLYCVNKGLQINASKTKYMSIKPHKSFKNN